MNLAMQIKLKRTELGLNQDDLADLAGITRNTMGKLEQGHYHSMNVRTILAVGRVLGLRVIISMEPEIERETAPRS